jgi:hypothetical protein
MQTKIVLIDNFQHILYKNERTGKWCADINEAKDYFYRSVMNSDDKKSRVIRKFYCESTIPYTREKIREMVNRDKGNIDTLYDAIINSKLQQE